ncbi:MAG: serine/threonine-protein kinase [Acidobacteria bacterium]|nr:serine/threonine-protein kinase [Acidobacteriota bacterium]
MALSIGTRIGPYEITGTLGAGGMGEVYRGRDARLARDVALKVLPATFADDPERLARFQREAQVLAALTHPNIGAIYGLEEQSDVVSGSSRTTRALVLELVDGDTLADRIARGAIPVDEALGIARQIAEALEAAHEQGIVHRDLKPANIKVSAEGVVKVLDFGLAKLTGPAEAGHYVPGLARADATASPTITTPAMMTGVGVILGTAAYMAPEQAKGRPADKRSDIWAFGCVLYEMLTAKRAFEGEDVSDTLAAVLRAEPDWSALPQTVPASVRALLEGCLTKDRRQRIADVSTPLFVMRQPAPQVSGPSAPDSARAWEAGHGALPAPRRPLWRRALPYAVAVAVTTAAAAAVAWRVWPAPRPLQISRFDYVLPEGRLFRNIGRPTVAFSPDGRYVVYNATGGLYLRAMDELQARLIPGTEAGLTNPFFSPDGQTVAYEQGSELKRVSISGGAPVVICAVKGGAAGGMFGASWGTDNTILFGQPEGIMRVSANGGTPELAIKAGEGEQVYGPQWLPDGDSVLFSVTTGKGMTRWDQAQIVAQSLRTGERKVVLRGGSDARYLPTGHLVYALGETLLAVAFDADRLEVAGGPVSVVEGIMRADTRATASATANYGVSDEGTLVYGTGSVAPSFGALAWVDRNGKAEPLSDRQAPYRAPRVSPDGARVAVAMQNPDGNEDIWVVDVERGTHTRLTSDPGIDTVPLWTPDGTHITFSSGRAGGASALYRMSADGSGAVEELTKASTNQGATSWLSDGTALAFYDVGGSYDIFTVKPGESPVRFSETSFREQGPAFSPDGRWLAYSSDETGQAEIYVTRYPGPGGRTAISTGGGRSPRWSSNGRELFYRNGRQMIAVAVEPGQTLRTGTPRVLFEGEYVQELENVGAHNYDVSRDGQRFLMIVPAPSEKPGENARQRIVVVQNWFEELRRRVPVP